MRATLLTLLLAAAVARAGDAQTIRIGIHGVGMSHAEIKQDLRSEGGGFGGLLSVRYRRLGLDVSGHTVSLDSVDGGPGAFDLLQGDVRLSFLVTPGLAIEVGGGRRKVDPEFASQDIGLGRVGLLSEVALSKMGSVWGRGAYLINPTFNGGGDAGLAVELGLGAAIGTSNGRFRLRFEYEFQRIDREVAAAKVPIQAQVGKVGLDVGF